MKTIYWSCLAVIGLMLVSMGVTYAGVNDGLVGHWPLDGNANDTVNGNDGTVVGALPTTDRFGNPNSAYSFDGMDDYIQTLDNGPAIGNEEYSIALWVKPDVQANHQGWIFDPRGDIYDGRYYAQIVVLAPDHQSYPNRLWVGVFDGTCLNCPSDDPDSGKVSFRGSNYPVINDDQWHHIVFIGDNVNDEWMLYIDGELIETRANTLENTSVTQPIAFGREQYNNRPPRYKGAIDDVRVYNRALSSVEAQQLFDPPPQLVCNGFEPPMETYPVTVKGNRALPLKAQLFDADGYFVTDMDIVAAPVLQVMFQSVTGGTPEDVTDLALPAGLGNEGNQFVFTDELKWQYNLKTKDYTASGTYTISIVSGDDAEYVIDPACETSFERN
jgi:hypothetical protein